MRKSFVNALLVRFIRFSSIREPGTPYEDTHHGSKREETEQSDQKRQIHQMV